MRIGQLSPTPGSKRRRKRVGFGIGSGRGKTCGRGMKGQHARGSVPPRFEGGQTPLYRRMRKLRGVSKAAMPRGMFRKEYAIVNVGQLARFDAGTNVTPELLVESGVIKSVRDGVRVLGEGEITKPLRVLAAHFSASARAKLEGAGGSVEEA
ncbi:MAG: 50S ribosomal protein L15 [Armatimonadota bacterium]|nr:MAG: 50S ribosomal protein L15 [Armatimonadota bacterium]